MATHPFDLAGKVALVTGAYRGLGFAIAEGLAQAGATVVLMQRWDREVAAERGLLLVDHEPAWRALRARRGRPGSSTAPWASASCASSSRVHEEGRSCLKTVGLTT